MSLLRLKELMKKKLSEEYEVLEEIFDRLTCFYGKAFKELSKKHFFRHSSVKSRSPSNEY